MQLTKRLLPRKTRGTVIDRLSAGVYIVTRLDGNKLSIFQLRVDKFREPVDVSVIRFKSRRSAGRAPPPLPSRTVAADPLRINPLCTIRNGDDTGVGFH